MLFALGLGDQVAGVTHECDFPPEAAHKTHLTCSIIPDGLDEDAADRVVAVDAAASFSRPGPRLVEGTELLAHLMHPDRVAPPGDVTFEEVGAVWA